MTAILGHRLSGRPNAVNWPVTRIARADLAAEIAAIKAGPGPDVMVHGGASFAAALAAQGLIDEYCLVIQPTAIGSGQGLFAKLAAPLRLDLVEARSFDARARRSGQRAASPPRCAIAVQELIIYPRRRQER
jgi:dihydrofolate reductase